MVRRPAAETSSTSTTSGSPTPPASSSTPPGTAASRGVGQVITGWDQGVQGMKVGGRRRLDIPAALGYGDMGAPPVIAPGESLVFVCDLVAVHKR